MNAHYKTLFSAIENNEVETVKHLLDDPTIDVNAQDDFCKTTLQFASEKGFLEVVQILLAKGANVNKRSNSSSKTFNWSALDYATANDHIDVVRVLLAVENIELGMPFGWNKNLLESSVKSQLREYVTQPSKFELFKLFLHHPNNMIGPELIIDYLVFYTDLFSTNIPEQDSHNQDRKVIREAIKYRGGKGKIRPFRAFREGMYRDSRVSRVGVLLRSRTISLIRWRQSMGELPSGESFLSQFEKLMLVDLVIIGFDIKRSKDEYLERIYKFYVKMLSSYEPVPGTVTQDLMTSAKQKAQNLLDKLIALQEALIKKLQSLTFEKFDKKITEREAQSLLEVLSTFERTLKIVQNKDNKEKVSKPQVFDLIVEQYETSDLPNSFETFKARHEKDALYCLQFKGKLPRELVMEFLNCLYESKRVIELSKRLEIPKHLTEMLYFDSQTSQPCLLNFQQELFENNQGLEETIQSLYRPSMSP